MTACPSVSLSELITLQRGFDLPESARKDGDVPVVASTGIAGYHNEVRVSAPGVVIGRSGSIGGGQYVTQDFWPLNTTLWVKDFKGHEPRFIYYLLRSIDFSRFNAGAGVPTLNRNHLDSMKVPSFDQVREQRIAALLSAYDDLIENNRRRIKLLEDAARLLYREWFPHLRFPGHEHVKVVDGVPEGWVRKTLGSIATLHYGKALKAEQRVRGPYDVYGSSGIVGSHNAALSSGPGIIVGRKGNVGSVYWSSEGFFAIDTVYFIDAETSNFYLYYALKNAQFISTDVAVPGLNRDFAYSRLMLVPPKPILDGFLESVAPMHRQIDKLTQYNQKLREARDLLLPRLMSGDMMC